MIKVFAFSGSPRGEDSVCTEVINRIVEIFSTRVNEQIEVEFFSMKNTSIQFCTGCENCFCNGTCPLDSKDSMEEIKNSLLESDYILFASPIYSASVNAFSKLLIDRLSYWLHIFKLAGKKAILINSSTGNGRELTNVFLGISQEDWDCRLLD